MLLEQPITRAAKLQPGAVHQQLHGTGAWPWANHLQVLGAAAQGRVIGRREIQTEQGDDGADQPFGLPQRRAGHHSRRQRRRDGQAGVVPLTVSRGPWFSCRGRDRRVGEPDRQAAALPQGRIAGGRVRGAVPLLRDVVATLGIGFERQAQAPQDMHGAEPPLAPLSRASPDRRFFVQQRSSVVAFACGLILVKSVRTAAAEAGVQLPVGGAWVVLGGDEDASPPWRDAHHALTGRDREVGSRIEDVCSLRRPGDPERHLRLMV